LNNNIRSHNDQSQNKDRRNEHDKSKVECFKYNKFEHYAYTCYTKWLPRDKKKLNQIG